MLAPREVGQAEKVKATKNGASVVLEGASCGPFPYAGMIRFRFQGFFSGCIPFFGGTATPNGHQQDSSGVLWCQPVRTGRLW